MNQILLLFTLLFTMNVYGQEHNHKEEHVHHNHHKNEIGIANSPTYFLKEKEFSYGLHIHYIRNIFDSKFGIGLGYEKIFDDHNHSTIGVVFNYNPFERLYFNVSPGITFEKQNSSGSFAIHFETSYEFELFNFHIGPVAEFAYDPEDIHLSLGIHIGYGF